MHDDVFWLKPKHVPHLRHIAAKYSYDSRKCVIPVVCVNLEIVYSQTQLFHIGVFDG